MQLQPPMMSFYAEDGDLRVEPLDLIEGRAGVHVRNRNHDGFTVSGCASQLRQIRDGIDAALAEHDAMAEGVTA